MAENHKTHITAKNGWFDIDFRELLRYKDLIILFVKRDYMTKYKQTILGPLWLVVNPLLTVALYAFVFGNIANLSTDGMPQLAFYLVSNALWSYFSTSLTGTAGTFTDNSTVFSKVYFPRLVMPVATTITGLLNLAVQLAMFLCLLVYYAIVGTPIQIGLRMLLAPVVLLQMLLLGLGCGIIVSSLTTKYRDLKLLVGFGVQLWMYASPVVYSTSQIPQNYLRLYMLNPVAPIMTMWRYAFLGAGEPAYGYWGISWIVTLLVLALGVILFSRVEKDFIDTV